MSVREVELDDVIEGLRSAAEAEGLTLHEMLRLARVDALESPRLRDLLLIWGDALEDHPAVG